MTPATLLRFAPAGAVLVSRPRGACHASVGTLTPSGRLHGRPVCGTRTRRLYADTRSSPRVCRRCVAALVPVGAATHPVHRDEWRSEYGSLTAFDLAIDAFLAETPDEVARVRFLAVLLVGWPAMSEPVVSPSGHVGRSLIYRLNKADARCGTPPDEFQVRLAAKVAADSANAEQARKNNARAIAEDRERAAAEAGRYVPSWLQPA